MENMFFTLLSTGFSKSLINELTGEALLLLYMVHLLYW